MDHRISQNQKGLFSAVLSLEPSEQEVFNSVLLGGAELHEAGINLPRGDSKSLTQTIHFFFIQMA